MANCAVDGVQLAAVRCGPAPVGNRATRTTGGSGLCDVKSSSGPEVQGSSAFPRQWYVSGKALRAAGRQPTVCLKEGCSLSELTVESFHEVVGFAQA